MNILMISLLLIYATLISLIWPKCRKKFREKIITTRFFLYLLQKLKKYHDTCAIITAPIYFALGLTFGTILLFIEILFIPQFLTLFISVFLIISPVKTLAYAFLLFLSSTVVIMTINTLFFNKVLENLLRGKGFSEIFRNTWIEDYLNTSPKVLFPSMLLAIISEEFFFRVILTLGVYYCLEGNQFLKILIASVISTSFFVIHQIGFLRTELQIILLLPTSIILGLLNSIALLFHASFWSLVLAHYFYVILFLTYMRRNLTNIQVL